jgi:hypothetical protein
MSARTEGTITGRDTELAERVEALLAELDERLEVYADRGPTVALAMALAWVAGRHDLSDDTTARVAALHTARRMAPHYRQNGRRGAVGEGTD